MAAILRRSLEEFGANVPGTAYFDSSTDKLYETYQGENSAYFVAIENGEVLGGAGIYPTEGLPADTTELLKMYVSSASRGKGVGKALMAQCMAFAKSAGFSRLYLETMPELSAAVAVYKKLGFKELPARLGNTEHFSCTIWMVIDLN